MRQGATPSYVFTLPIAASELDLCHITFKQHFRVIAERNLEDCTIDGKKVACTLTEKETLAFLPDCHPAEVQIRCGIGSARFPSQIFKVDVKPALQRSTLAELCGEEETAPTASMPEGEGTAYASQDGWSMAEYDAEFDVDLGELLRGPKGDPGKDGAPGKDGITPTIGENGNWFLGDEDTGKPSRGEKGETVQPDWAQNDETAKDYVKNRPFYSKETTREVLGEDFDAWKACVLAHGGEISENDPAGWPITFSFAGKDYSLTGTFVEETNSVQYALTKFSEITAKSYYAIWVYAFGANPAVFVATGIGNQPNVSFDFILPEREEIKYLDPKFIKDMYYEETDSGNVQICSFSAGSYTPKYVTLSEPLIEGATYEILFDGTYSTKSVCTNGGENSDALMLTIQKSPQDYYGALCAQAASATAIQYRGNPSKVADITVVRIAPKVTGFHQIPAKYIPPREPLTVTFTNDDDGNWSADKTFAEVKAAIEAGRFVQADGPYGDAVPSGVSNTDILFGYQTVVNVGSAIAVIISYTYDMLSDGSFDGWSLTQPTINPAGLEPKTDAMTQPVGVDEDGKLWTAPGGGSVTADGITTALGYTPRKAWYVKLTGTKASPTADQTAAAIYQAYTDGYAVYGIVQMSEILEGFPIILPLLYAYGSSASVGALCFAGSANPHLTGTMEQNTTITATYDGSWHVFVDSQPTALKNPHALTIKLGSETITYDGSAAKTVEIADGTEVSY